MQPKGISLNCLDVVQAVQVYLYTTSSFKLSDSPLIISAGPHKGQPAIPSTINLWLMQPIGLRATFPVSWQVHSSRSAPLGLFSVKHLFQI